MNQTLSDVDLGYLCGIMDGEGSFVANLETGRSSYRLRIQVKMTEQHAVVWLHSTFGGSLTTHQPRQPNTKRAYQWRLDGEAAVRLAILMEPHLRVKRAQAQLASSWPLWRGESAKLRRHELGRAIQMLNASHYERKRQAKAS